MSVTLRVAIVAGEKSGDVLGAELLSALKVDYPSIEIEGIGGDLMQAQGLKSLAPIEWLSIMGLVEVLGSLFKLLSLRKRLIQYWKSNPPDVFIGIDAPDFNLNLEKKLKAAGIVCVHYVSPSIWAWRPNRIFNIIKSNHLMLTLFPFEKKLYDQQSHPAAFVGHPLADKYPLQVDTSLARKQLGLSQRKTWIALLPGSRKREVLQHGIKFLQAAELIHQQRPETGFIIPAATEQIYQDLELIIQRSYSHLCLNLQLNQSGRVMSASDAILIASGTATLEALFCKKPMVVAYHMSSISYWVLNKMVKSPWVSLPNILAQRTLVPELLQNEMTPQNMAKELLSWLNSPDRINTLKMEFEGIHMTLQQNANQKAAEAINKVLAGTIKKDGK